MKIRGANLRPGHVIEHEGGLWRVVDAHLSQASAQIRVEIGNLADGRRHSLRFRSGDTVERVPIESRYLRFVYADGDSLNFMNDLTDEQTAIPSATVGDAAPFLRENMTMVVDFYGENPVAVHPPRTAPATVVETHSAAEGDPSGYKPAMLDNGVRIMVPPFVESGATIIVDVRKRTFESLLAPMP